MAKLIFIFNISKQFEKNFKHIEKFAHYTRGIILSNFYITIINYNKKKAAHYNNMYCAVIYLIKCQFTYIYTRICSNRQNNVYKSCILAILWIPPTFQ